MGFLPGGIEGLSLVLRAGADLAGRLPGGASRGVVVSGETGLSVRVGSTLLSLPSGTNLNAGQAVLVRADLANNRVVIEPLVQQAAAPRSPSVLDALQRLLGTLPGGSPTTAAAAARILPGQLPVTLPVLQHLFSLLGSGGQLGTDLSRVVNGLNGAVQAGVISAETARELERLIGPRDGRKAEHFLDALRSVQRVSGRSAEAALAARLAGEDGVEHLRLLLASFRGNARLREFLASEGRLRGFMEALEGVDRRLSSGALMNARALDTPYLYMELPMPPGGLLKQVRIHGHGGGGNQRDGASRPEHVSLDVSTTRLGAFWVDVLAVGEVCRCRVDADSEAARAAVDAGREELRERLEAVGFREAHVVAGRWNGDRWARLAATFERAGAFDAEA